jgi:hypothetical protein
VIVLLLVLHTYHLAACAQGAVAGFAMHCLHRPSPPTHGTTPTHLPTPEGEDVERQLMCRSNTEMLCLGHHPTGAI